MRYIVLDMSDGTLVNTIQELQGQDLVVIDATKPMAKCVGCFKCWMKHPGRCVFADRMQLIGSKLLTSDEILIICDSLYGGFSVNIKRILDRTIPGVLPFFMKKKNELHHLPRYQNRTTINVFFTNGSNMTEAEKELSYQLVEAMSVNFYAKEHNVVFLNTKEELYRRVVDESINYKYQP